MAAIELAEEGGFEAVRLRDVAAHADVALGTLYRRFRSKEDLLLAALELQVTSLEQRFAAQPPAGGSPLERVHGFFRATTEAMCSRPHLARAHVRAVVAGGPDSSQRVAAFHDRMEALIARALRGRDGTELLSELERRVGQALLRVWFASLTGWASGLHGVDGIVEDTRSAADLMLGSACRPTGNMFESGREIRTNGREGLGAMKIVIDYDLCEANAVCMDVCPECFRVEDDDTLTVLIERPGKELRGKVEEAVRLCPRQAISLVED